MSVWGVMMNERFYPLVIKCLKSGEISSAVAEKCVDALGLFLNQISKGYDKPAIFLSTDSGFNSALLLKKMEEIGFVPVCVPKDTHRITYANKSLNIRALKAIFKKKEKKYFSKNPRKNLFLGKSEPLIKCTNER